MLDIQLQVFKVVVDRKSFSQAAQELHMTQSSVSQHIHNLEAKYGVRLFDRLHRRIELTAAGSALYPYAEELDRLGQEIVRTMQNLTDKVAGRLRIGASLTIGEYMMPPLLVQFSRLYPDVDIVMEIFNTDQITAMAIEGSIDLGFIEGHRELPGVLVPLPCGGDELVIIAPPDYKAPAGELLSLQQLLRARWVLREQTSGTRRVFEQFVAACGINTVELNVVMELGSNQAVKEAVKAGLGISAMSRLAVDEGVRRGEMRILPLAEGSIDRTFTLLYHREKFSTYTVEKFLAFIAATVTPKPV